MQFARREPQTLNSEKARADAWKLLEESKTTRDKYLSRVLAYRAFLLAQLAGNLEQEALPDPKPMSDVIECKLLLEGNEAA